jgi:hypothetical protein
VTPSRTTDLRDWAEGKYLCPCRPHSRWRGVGLADDTLPCGNHRDLDMGVVPNRSIGTSHEYRWGTRTDGPARATIQGFDSERALNRISAAVSQVKISACGELETGHWRQRIQLSQPPRDDTRDIVLKK